MKVDLGIVIVISKYLIQRHFFKESDTKNLQNCVVNHTGIPGDSES